MESNLNALAETFGNKFQAFILFSSSIPEIMFHFHKIRKKQNLLHSMIFFPVLSDEWLNGEYHIISLINSFIFPVRRH